MTFEIFLKVIRNFLDIEELAFDETGVCSLEIQDEFLLLLKWDEKEERFVVTAEMKTPSPLPEKLMAAALTFNFKRMAASGSWISLDPSTEKFFLVDEYLLKILDEERLEKRLQQFFQHYLTCQGIFNEQALEILLKKEDELTVRSHQLA